MPNNIETFGQLEDDGHSGDHKRTFITGGEGIAVEIDTDDCDRQHALKFKQALIEAWNQHDKLKAALTKIANYEGEPIWQDDRYDAANEMVRIAQEAISGSEEE